MLTSESKDDPGKGQIGMSGDIVQPQKVYTSPKSRMLQLNLKLLKKKTEKSLMKESLEDSNKTLNSNALQKSSQFGSSQLIHNCKSA